jgi:beta-mannosidase
MGRQAPVEGHEIIQLSEGWELACAPPDLHVDPTELQSLEWLPASVPGTAAGALRDAGAWRPGESYDFDAEDWWFRTSFQAARARDREELVLALDGIATVAQVFLNGELVLESDSMFLAHEVHIEERLRETNELAIRCRALGPLLSIRRRPRARWRTRLVAEGNLRFFRTMLLGRAPGIAPGPAAVGPWRGIRLERRREVVLERLELRTSLQGGAGRVSLRTSMRALGPAPSSIELEISRGSEHLRAPLALTTSRDGTLEAEGELVVAEPALWWPHTHGEPALYEARLIVAGSGPAVTVEVGRVGFRTLEFGSGPEHEIELAGLDLHVNGVSIFARGCVWTQADPVGLTPGEPALRRALEHVRDAGMNLLRIPGTSAYEESSFHDLCDELGILVWQDLMFANLDYPIEDQTFRTAVVGEAEQMLEALAGRPSLAVVCGNSEVEQQVAMLGLDRSLGRGELFGEILPGLLRASGADAAYVPSAPCGGELPFRPGRGIANYYGVGGYRRPLEDARRAEVRFAAECLAFSNIPDEQAIEEMLHDAPGQLAVHDPRWKAGVPRDAGSGWDFEDVRDHYLQHLFGVDPAELRRIDHDRYLELSRALTGEVMAEVFGEWRRAASPCRGALVLWLRDLRSGAGWGVLDDRGEPKVAYHHLRRALAPIAVWSTDEGLGGVEVHAANDRPSPLAANLRIALYRDFEHPVEEALKSVELPAHGSGSWDVEALLGHFVDASWAYRFGPPAQDLIVISLEGKALEGPGQRGQLLSQAVRFPAGRPLSREPASRLGLSAHADELEGGSVNLTIHSDRLAYGVRLHTPGFAADDNAFSVEPGRGRSVVLRPRQEGQQLAEGWLTALNLQGRVKITR